MSELEVRPMSMLETEAYIASGTAREMVVALISAALYGEDRERVFEIVFDSLRHDDSEVVDAAIISIGHIARIDRKCDAAKLRSVFQMLTNDLRYHGRLGDALDDIETYTSVRRTDILSQ